ncbi:uncharacterized protein LOC122252933 [Penaeus japonicus]|uniref:uncharacterized protein LOC122252933 n=1 Tax=Penaeus japonicus TaxID=27405 RepID=UPI001C715D4B|nr:uncharacterized protein LOC122252933 [Penaeus japonicus]
MKLLCVHVLCLFVIWSGVGGEAPEGCVIIEVRETTVKLNKELLNRPLYLWPQTSQTGMTLYFIKDNGMNETTETFHLKDDNLTRPGEWNRLEIPHTKTDHTSRLSVSILPVNKTRILRNSTNSSLKELQIKVTGRALLAFNCPNSTNPPILLANFSEEAVSTEVTQPSERSTSDLNVWKICLLLLLPICFLSVLRTLWAFVRKRSPAGQTGRSQEADLPLVSPVVHDPPPPIPRRFAGLPLAEGGVGRDENEEVPDDSRAMRISYESVNSLYGISP